MLEWQDVGIHVYLGHVSQDVGSKLSSLGIACLSHQLYLEVACDGSSTIGTGVQPQHSSLCYRRRASICSSFNCLSSISRIMSCNPMVHLQTCLGRIHLQLEFKISCSNRSWQEDSYSTSASVTVYRSEILLRHVSKDVIKSRSWRIHPQDSNSLMPALVLMEEEIVCKRWNSSARAGV